MSPATLVSLTLAAATCLTSPLLAEGHESPPPLNTPALRLAGIDTLSDAECIAIQHYLQRGCNAALLAMADYLEECGTPKLSEHESERRTLRAIAEVSREQLPADFRDYLAAYYALEAEMREKSLPLEARIADDMSEKEEENLKGAFYQLIHEHNERLQELRRLYPRPADILPGEAPLLSSKQVVYDISGYRDFLREHPEHEPQSQQELPRAIAAFWRHMAARPLSAPNAAEARRLLVETALHDFQADIPTCEAVPMGRGYKTNLYLPQNRDKGYGWKLATLIPEGAPCKLTEQRCIPVAEWEAELNRHKQCPHLSLLPRGTTHVEALTLLPEREGSIRLQFILMLEGEDVPVFRQEMEYIAVIPQAAKKKQEEPTPRPAAAESE